VAVTLIVENLHACIVEEGGDNVPSEALAEAKRLFMSL